MIRIEFSGVMIVSIFIKGPRKRRCPYGFVQGPYCFIKAIPNQTAQLLVEAQLGVAQVNDRMLWLKF